MSSFPRPEARNRHSPCTANLPYENPRPTPRQAAVRTRPSAVGMVAVVIWFLLAGVALLIGAASVSAFAGLTQGLDDPTKLNDLPVQQQSVIYDRTGKIELARVGLTRRDVATFDEIPPIVIDAQTAVEDKTFWDNSGFDPLAIVSAGIDSLRGRSRGASTITQQLVRQRLLNEDLVQDPKRQLERKLKEIIQSIRLTQAFPGETGKQTIITTYLNQNYYGNQTYGVKAAAKAYFGKELKDLTIAEAAILAALPKSPSNYDLVKNAVDAMLRRTRRRRQLRRRVDARRPARDGHRPAPEHDPRPPRPRATATRSRRASTPARQFLDAKKDEVVLAPQKTPQWVAPHFVWAVQKEMADKLCGVDVPTCDTLEAGGLRVTTTLDVTHPEDRREMGQGRRLRPQLVEPPDAAPRS